MFFKRIVNLRKQKAITQEKLAAALGISRSALSLYEIGKREPDIDTIIKIATFFNISVDYLLGIEKSNGNDYSNFVLDNSEFVLDFKMRIQELMNEQNMSKEIFSQKTGFHWEDTEAFLYGNRIPTIEELIKISGALHVSTDYLLDMSQRKRISSEDELLLQTITDRERSLIDAFRQLETDNQDIIIGDSKKYLKEQRYEKSVAADEIKGLKTGTDNLGK